MFDVVMTGFPGKGDTVTELVVLLQPVEVDVKVKVTVPTETPVTNPVVLLMVAAPGVLLTQVPPVLGLTVIVAPTHNAADGVFTDGVAG